MPGPQFRQGDVLLLGVEAPAQEGWTVSPGHPALVTSAASGHTQRVEGEAHVYRVGARMWVHVVGPAQLSHEEHRSIALPPGWYVVVQQREYVPGGQRRVQD
jgi:hypothetical protein